jgi:hypothetical protein
MYFTRILLSFVFVLFASTALAAKPSPAEGNLTIIEVSVDYGTSSMVIIGYDLDFGDGPLAVILGDTDITADCALDLPLADPQTITCVGLALPVATDLLLIVSNGNGQKQTDEYDLTFGAVGPQGEKGETGADGLPPPTYSHGVSCVNDAGCDNQKDGSTGGVLDQIIPDGLECPDPGDRMLAGGCDCSPGASSDTEDGTCRITQSRPISSNWVGGEEAWTCTADDAELMHVYVYCADVDGDGPGPGS